MNNTALGAEKAREIIFISDAHEKFYYEKLKEVRCQDEYHKALCYCLGISADTRKNINRIYDFKTGNIKTECLREGWQTSGSVRVVRLAFNLYCNGTPSVSDYEDAEEQIDECREYTVEELFCCAYAPYFWQAVQIRYPDGEADSREAFMGKPLRFDYYYGIEAEQFTFYRVPRLLIKDARFRDLSCEAKLLYGLMLDRLSLSLKNGWLDDQNRAFIHYTLENIVDDLCCSTGKCVKVLAELDDKKGIGLIERKKQGLGKPDIIYVKNFDSIIDGKSPEVGEENHTETVESPDLQDVKVQTSQNQKSRLSNFASQDLQKMEIQSSQNCNSGITKIETPDFHGLPPNNNNHNNTDPSYTNHINQSGVRE